MAPQPAQPTAPTVPTVPVHSADGTETGEEVQLDASLFGIEPNLAVLHEVVTAQLAARRSGSHSTKTRAEVRGGGRKPWRQKGTGRARAGSIRSPQFTGGGVAHGPKPRSYKKKVNRKTIRLALSSALSDRAASERIRVVDEWRFDPPSTKQAIQALSDLQLDGQVLVVLGDQGGDQETATGAPADVANTDRLADRSFRNLPNVSRCATGELNAYDILRSDWLVFTTSSLPTASGPDEETAAAPAAEQPVADEPEPATEEPAAAATDTEAPAASADDAPAADEPVEDADAPEAANDTEPETPEETQ